MGDRGGRVVWESHTILRYLAARHGRGRFWSEDAGERSLDFTFGHDRATVRGRAAVAALHLVRRLLAEG